jgi:hypothetical protein
MKPEIRFNAYTQILAEVVNIRHFLSGLKWDEMPSNEVTLITQAYLNVQGLEKNITALRRLTKEEMTKVTPE